MPMCQPPSGWRCNWWDRGFHAMMRDSAKDSHDVHRHTAYQRQIWPGSNPPRESNNIFPGGNFGESQGWNTGNRDNAAVAQKILWQNPSKRGNSVNSPGEYFRHADTYKNIRTVGYHSGFDPLESKGTPNSAKIDCNFGWSDHKHITRRESDRMAYDIHRAGRRQYDYCQTNIEVRPSGIYSKIYKKIGVDGFTKHVPKTKKAQDLEDGAVYEEEE